eukprot:TRINITY_DN59783_c0_g1_i1.p1 TRINITY_DN59783_c0_g1~~TRINITY_DN59783_c0_g1_i1.p1  ORF type:complete len:277 (+),score=60.40 TRINITY_DN59783_c0_g1_i1:3-833(+)
MPLDTIDAINMALDRLERSRPSAPAVSCPANPLSGVRVLVTGANRGLGLGFVRHLLEQGAIVVAACRTPDKADALNELLAGCDKSFSVKLDIADPDSVQSAAVEVSTRLGALDVLINNAGISSSNHPNDPILTAEAGDVSNVFSTNVLGTIAVTNGMLAMLRNGSLKKVINLSSQLASIEHCFGIQGRFGGVCSYRISRAASNMAMRTFAGELREEGFVFVSMSPGHVDTDMGSAGGRKPPLTVDQSVGGMLEVIATLGEEDNGSFKQYDGQTLPW